MTATATTHSETDQPTLFDEDPATNSPDDLGYGNPPPPGDLEKKEEPPITTLPLDHANKFLDWLDEQDVSKSSEISLIGVLEAFSGLDRGDLKWLCGAICQAKRAPGPGQMKKATLARDVAMLRKEDPG